MVVVVMSNATFAPDTFKFPSSDSIDPSIVRILDVFANCFVINIISMFGIVGNSINIAVLRQHGTRESTNIILISLSVSDLLFSTLLPVTRLKCVVGHFDPALATSLNTFVTVYFFMPKFVCLGTSFFYVSLIAIERFVAVFFPFRVSKILTRRTVFILSLSIFFFSLAAISPSFLTFRLVWVYDQEFKKTVAVVELTEFYQTNHVVLDFYIWIGLNNLFCAISVSLVFACCVAICVKLNRAARKRELMTSSNSAGYDVKVVKMLVTVCCIYLCVIIPTITMYMFFKPSFIFESPVHKVMNDVCDILCAVNASANFLVYVSMSKKFARTYQRLLGCHRERNKKGGRKDLKQGSVVVDLANKIIFLRKWLS